MVDQSKSDMRVLLLSLLSLSLLLPWDEHHHYINNSLIGIYFQMLHVWIIYLRLLKSGHIQGEMAWEIFSSHQSGICLTFSNHSEESQIFDRNLCPGILRGFSVSTNFSFDRKLGQPPRLKDDWDDGFFPSTKMTPKLGLVPPSTAIVITKIFYTTEN